MFIYLILALITIVLILFDSYSKSIKNISISKILSIFLICILFLVSAFRTSSVGADTKIYLDYYEIIRNNTLFYSLNNLTFLESGYIIFNKLVSIFTTNFNSITFFNSLLVLFSLYKLIKNQSKDALLSIFLFITFGFYQSTFNIARSCFAVFVGYEAIDKFDNNKKIKGILLFILAFLFHKSSIILLLIPILSKFKFKKKYIKYYVLLIIILFYGLEFLMPILNTLIQNDYSYYLARKNEGVVEKIFLLIVHLGLFIPCSFLIKDKNNYVKNNKRYYIFILLETLFYLFSIKYTLFLRVAYIFAMYNIVSIPNIITDLPKQKKSTVKALVIILCFIQFILRLNINNIGNTIPYKSILFK